MDSQSTDTQPLSRLATSLALFAIAILLFNVVLVVFDVLMRWLAGDPQSWVSDVAELTYPIAIICCFPAAIESGSMIVIRFFGSFAGPRIAWLLDCIGQVALTLLLALFTWKIFWRGVSDWTTGFVTLNLKFPIAPTWIVVAALLALSTLVQLRRTWLITIGRIEHA